jgi:hypothetical protein
MIRHKAGTPYGMPHKSIIDVKVSNLCITLSARQANLLLLSSSACGVVPQAYTFLRLVELAALQPAAVAPLLIARHGRSQLNL